MKTASCVFKKTNTNRDWETDEHRTMKERKGRAESSPSKPRQHCPLQTPGDLLSPGPCCKSVPRKSLCRKRSEILEAKKILVQGRYCLQCRAGTAQRCSAVMPSTGFKAAQASRPPTLSRAFGIHGKETDRLTRCPGELSLPASPAPDHHAPSTILSVQLLLIKGLRFRI